MSAIAREQHISKCNRYLINCRTEVIFLAHAYKFVYCLDMSPSQSIVDIQKGEILFDEILNSFKASVDGLTQQVFIHIFYSGISKVPKEINEINDINFAVNFFVYLSRFLVRSLE